MIVLDASAAVDLLLERGERGERVRALVERHAYVAAPHVIDLEVASAVRRLAALGEIGSRRGHTALADLTAMPLQRYPATALLERIWQLRDALTPHDAAYVALAEILAVALVTTDERLGRSRGHLAQVESLG